MGSYAPSYAEKEIEANQILDRDLGEDENRAYVEGIIHTPRNGSRVTLFTHQVWSPHRENSWLSPHAWPPCGSGPARGSHRPCSRRGCSGARPPPGANTQTGARPRLRGPEAAPPPTAPCAPPPERRGGD